MKCKSSLTVTFSGITFDGSLYGFTGDVNQSFTIDIDHKESSTTFCVYHSGVNTSFPHLEVGCEIKQPNRVTYQLLYMDGGNELGILIFNGIDNSLIIQNGEQFGGTAAVQLN